MSWDKTEGGDFGHSGGTSRAENFIRGLNIELANERNLRATAEAEVERLRLMVKSITGGLDEAVETVNFLEAENAKLRAALNKLARLGNEPNYGNSDGNMIARQALAELDEADHE